MVEIEVLAPATYDVEEFVREIQRFAAGVKAAAGDKALRYSLTRAPPAALSPVLVLDFKVHCFCMLNMNWKNCSKLRSMDDCNSKVKRLSCNKTTRFEELEFQLSTGLCG